MKLSDYVFDFIADQGVKHVFFVPGGGAMHLNDSLGRNERLTAVNCMHEQAAGMAAEAYAQFNGLGVCLVTSGPGGTNAITACASAWTNSMPVLFISGQVNTYQLKTQEQRFNGMQELDIISMVEPITKYAVTCYTGEILKAVLGSAIEFAKAPRQGPTWIDVPLDISAVEV